MEVVQKRLGGTVGAAGLKMFTQASLV